MPKLVVKLGTDDARHPLDGEYDTGVIGEFTSGEWLTIRRLSDLRPSEFLDNFFNSDAGALIATAFIILQREGFTPDAELLFGAPFDAIDFQFPEIEAAMKAAAKKQGGKKDPPKKPSSETGSSDGKNDDNESSG